MTRTEKSTKNLVAAIVGQSIGLIISFIARIFFIKILGAEYLGLNGLFTNILTVLSLAELGVGEAITYSLYEPLAHSNYHKCEMLMFFYKRIYIIIGFTILFFGLCIVPFLPHLIKEMPAINNINIIYILFVLNTSVSYFFSYKRNLIIADQKRYIATIYRYAAFSILNVVQVIYIVLTRNYIGFLVLQIMCTLIENFLISLKANELYPFLKKQKRIRLEDTAKKEIMKNTKAMMMHKVGGVVVNSTDNILLSKYVGLYAVGLYSNYYLIIYALNVIYSQLYSSLQASIGNLCVEKNEKKQYDVYEKIDFLTFWIYAFSAVSLICLFNPFIELWIGKEYVFNIKIVIILVFNFYITGLRKSNLTFREASGLFYLDRWKAIVEAVINLVVSIILAKRIGIAGVFIGTIISTLITCSWVEPYILYKNLFNVSFKHYCIKYIKRLILTITIAIFTFSICSIIKASILIEFFLKLFMCIIIPNLMLLIIFRKNDNYIFYKKTIINLIGKIRFKNKETS